jgi:DNA-binding NtrC family response regulator
LKEVVFNSVPLKESGKDPRHVSTILLLGFVGDDLDFLRELLDCAECPLVRGGKWAVEIQANVAETLTAVCRDDIPVVLCDHDRMPEGWKQLLAIFEWFSAPPCLILASRLADDRLWAEALNLGAYDVLARPFIPADVIRSVSLARLHRQGRVR